MERDILHLAIPSFPIALARLTDQSLRGRPVAIAAGHSDRAVIQCVSGEAKADGVHEGMSVYRARRSCVGLKLLVPDPERLARGTQALLEISAEYSPLTEISASGRFFLDLTGCRRLLGPVRDVAARMEKEVAGRMQLQGTVGVAGNKLVSRIAAGCLEKPGICDVLRGAERSFIAPLPVSVLPGIGEARQLTLLRDLNLRRVEELADLSVGQLGLAFGPFAPLLHQRARGVDPSPVQPPKRTPEITEEAFLSAEENDDSVLLAELCRLVEGCGLQLRQHARVSGKIGLRIHYADGVVHQRSMALPSPQNLDMVLFAASSRLFQQACQRRVRVRGMRLTCSHLSAEPRQIGLFDSMEDAHSPDMATLQEALDDLRIRFGRGAVQWGRTLPA